MEAVVAVAVAVQARVDDCEIDLERREGLGKVCSERQTERASSDPELEATRASRCVVIQDEIALWWRPCPPGSGDAASGRRAWLQQASHINATAAHTAGRGTAPATNTTTGWAAGTAARGAASAAVGFPGSRRVGRRRRADTAGARSVIGRSQRPQRGA